MEKEGREKIRVSRIKFASPLSKTLQNPDLGIWEWDLTQRVCTTVFCRGKLVLGSTIKNFQ
jgi:hypothetical protein